MDKQHPDISVSNTVILGGEPEESEIQACLSGEETLK